MFATLKGFFDKYLDAQTDKPSDDLHALQLASSALLIEMLYADGEVSQQEEQTLFSLLRSEFRLTDEETTDLVELAHQHKHDATDYYRFTSLLNQHYSQQQKIRLVKNMWRLAWADKRLDKFEEHLIRRLAELLHVPHSDFIRTKLEVMPKPTPKQ